jgi:hypothetical protein
MRARTNAARVRAVAVAACCAMLVGSAHSAIASGNKGSPTPKPGSYSGFDAVDTISLKVSANGKTITGLSSTFNPAADCGVPANAQHERFPTLTVKNGHFKGSTSIHAATVIHFAIQGRFVTPTEATGKISGNFKVRSLPPCSASTTFKVKRKGP